MHDRERPAPNDGVFMCRALSLAERGWGQTAPNPMVGAVAVHDGVVVGEGWHTAFGAPHAEVEALRVAGNEARGATLYVSLEPCSHHGKTPPCTDAISAAGIARVVIATRDPHGVARGGAAILRDRGIDVSIGLEEAAARQLNAHFFHGLSSDRAFVELKLAMSLDGAIADRTGRQAWLTGRESRREVHRLRAGVDAVAVGVGTAIADDPMLTVREFEPAPRVHPARVVFDRTARLPLDSRLVRSAREVRTIVICQAPDAARAQRLAAEGVELVDAQSLDEAMVALKSHGVRSLLVEGGALLASALMERALVDRLTIFRAPLLLGRGGLAAFGSVPGSSVAESQRWVIQRTCRFGDDEMTSYVPRH